MGILRKDENLLMWFFERGVSVFWRSTFGAMLERTEALAYDSEGRRIPASDAWTTGAELRVRGHREEASYEPEDSDLLRAAQVSRRLRLVRQRDAAAEETLEAYYGRAGARWARTTQGRIFALYPLTPTGEKFVREDLARRPDSNATAHERVLAETQVQLVAPTQPRRELLARIHMQAERRLTAAWDAWSATEQRPAIARAP